MSGDSEPFTLPDEQVELDGYTQAALKRYTQARAQLASAEEDSRKARDEILAFLAVHGVQVGAIEGVPVVKGYRRDDVRTSVPRLRKAFPALFEDPQYQTRIADVPYLHVFASGRVIEGATS